MFGQYFDILFMFLKAFLVGGAICMIAQIVINFTDLTAGKILVIFMLSLGAKRRKTKQNASSPIYSELSEVKMRRVRYIATNIGLHPKGDLLLVNEQGCVPILGIRYRAIRVFTLVRH